MIANSTGSKQSQRDSRKVTRRDYLIPNSLTKYVIVIVVLIMVTSFIPASIYTWPWNTINYVPFWFKFLWPCACIAWLLLLKHVCKIMGMHHLNKCSEVLIHVCLACLFIYLYTHIGAYRPTLEGDGEFSANLQFGMARTRDYLYTIIHYIHPQSSSAETLHIMNNVASIVYVAVIGLWTFNLRESYWIRMLLMIYLCANVTTAVFFGFADNYACTLTDYSLFFASFAVLVAARNRKVIGFALILCSLGALLVYHSHPAGSFAALLLSFYCAARFKPWTRIVPAWVYSNILRVALTVVSLICLFKFVPGAINQFVPSSLLPGQSGIIPFFGDYFIYQASMPFLSLLATAMAPWCVYVFYCMSHNSSNTNALTQTIHFAFLALLIVRYIMPTPTLGIWDFTALAGFGGFFLLLSVFIFTSNTFVFNDGNRLLAIMSFATLALFLYVPTAWVFHSSKDLVVQRCVDLFPYDRCPHNNLMSPYVHLGLALGDIPGLQSNRIDQFSRGSTCTLWREHNGLNKMYLTAWLYEYGRREEGKVSLKDVLCTLNPQSWGFLIRPGACFTTAAHSNIWVDSERLGVDLFRETHNSIYKELASAVQKLRANYNAAVNGKGTK